MAEIFPHYKQADSTDCGPTCLKIIAKHLGKALNIQILRQFSETTREGSNLLSLSETAAYGHMGRTPETVTKTFSAPGGLTKTVTVDLFTWEKLDFVDQVKTAFGL
jgi:ABC-type bacteriocin/lantibiotic exporter with double-glycine peptidase domain